VARISKRRKLPLGGNSQPVLLHLWTTHLAPTVVRLSPAVPCQHVAVIISRLSSPSLLGVPMPGRLAQAPRLLHLHLRLCVHHQEGRHPQVHVQGGGRAPHAGGPPLVVHTLSACKHKATLRTHEQAGRMRRRVGRTLSSRTCMVPAIWRACSFSASPLGEKSGIRGTIRSRCSHTCWTAVASCEAAPAAGGAAGHRAPSQGLPVHMGSRASDGRGGAYPR
jgi:hypothetical protein